MATFLELVSSVGSDSGTVSGTLASVASPTGRWGKIIGWTSEAWRRIQTSRADWTFRQKQFSASLTVGQMSYTAADLSIADFGGWMRRHPEYGRITIYDPAIGRGDENPLVIVPFEQWARSYDIGAPEQVRPNIIAEGPDRALKLGPPPDKAYTVRGWYRREIQILAQDDDEPFIDPEYHDTIKWLALMLLSQHDEATMSAATSAAQFRALNNRMLQEYLPNARVS